MEKTIAPCGTQRQKSPRLVLKLRDASVIDQLLRRGVSDEMHDEGYQSEHEEYYVEDDFGG